MASSVSVPTLRVVSPAEAEPVLPGAAEGDVEIYPGNEGLQAYGYMGGGYHWAHLPGIASFRLDEDLGVLAVPAVGASIGVVEDSYRRNVLPLALHLQGYEVVHGSAVSTTAGVVALCGASGVGKSTFAYGLSLRGHSVWADDAVALDISIDAATTFRLPFRLSVSDDARALLGNEEVRGPDEPAQSTVRALVILSRSDSSDGSLVDIDRLDPASAFAALFPHAYYFRLSDVARTKLMVERYLQLASITPTFDVRYRADIDHARDVVERVEHHLSL